MPLRGAFTTQLVTWAALYTTRDISHNGCSKSQAETDQIATWENTVEHAVTPASRLTLNIAQRIYLSSKLYSFWNIYPIYTGDRQEEWRSY
jgi:hypothetical protein